MHFQLILAFSVPVDYLLELVGGAVDVAFAELLVGLADFLQSFVV